MRILGIDPGYAIVGYGVIEAGGGRYRPVEYGAITTPAGQDFGQRLVEIYQGMGEILTRLKPEAAAAVGKLDSALPPEELIRLALKAFGQGK